MLYIINNITNLFCCDNKLIEKTSNINSKKTKIFILNYNSIKFFSRLPDTTTTIKLHPPRWGQLPDITQI